MTGTNYQRTNYQLTYQLPAYWYDTETASDSYQLPAYSAHNFLWSLYMYMNI